MMVTFLIGSATVASLWGTDKAGGRPVQERAGRDGGPKYWTLKEQARTLLKVGEWPRLRASDCSSRGPWPFRRPSYLRLCLEVERRTGPRGQSPRAFSRSVPVCWSCPDAT